MHHIAFSVENMDSVKNSLREIGVSIEQEGVFTGGAYAYTDSGSPLGIIIELLTHN